MVNKPLRETNVSRGGYVARGGWLTSHENPEVTHTLPQGKDQEEQDERDWRELAEGGGSLEM